MPQPQCFPIVEQPPRQLGLRPVQQLGCPCQFRLTHWWDSDPKWGVMLQFFLLFPLYCTIRYDSEPAPRRPSLYSLDWGKSQNRYDIICDDVAPLWPMRSTMTSIAPLWPVHSTMTSLLHLVLYNSLASGGECPSESSSFVVLWILRLVHLSSKLLSSTSC